MSGCGLWGGIPCSMGCGTSRFDEEVIKTAVRRLNPNVATGEARPHTGRSGRGCGRCGGVRVAHSRGPPLHCRAPTPPLPPRLLPPAALGTRASSLPAHCHPWRSGANSLLGAYRRPGAPCAERPARPEGGAGLRQGGRQLLRRAHPRRCAGALPPRNCTPSDSLVSRLWDSRILPHLRPVRRPVPGLRHRRDGRLQQRVCGSARVPGCAPNVCTLCAFWGSHLLSPRPSVGMSQFFVNSQEERNARLRDFAFNIMDVKGCGYVDKVRPLVLTPHIHARNAGLTRSRTRRTT